MNAEITACAPNVSIHLNVLSKGLTNNIKRPSVAALTVEFNLSLKISACMAQPTFIP